MTICVWKFLVAIIALKKLNQCIAKAVNHKNDKFLQYFIYDIQTI